MCVWGGVLRSKLKFADKKQLLSRLFFVPRVKNAALVNDSTQSCAALSVRWCSWTRSRACVDVLSVGMLSVSCLSLCRLSLACWCVVGVSYVDVLSVACLPVCFRWLVCRCVARVLLVFVLINAVHTGALLVNECLACTQALQLSEEVKLDEVLCVEYLIAALEEVRGWLLRC